MSSIFIDFRSTSAFVTDPSGATFCLSDAYPTTRAGLTFGWTLIPGGNADRLATNPAQLAGINYQSNGVHADLQVDLAGLGGSGTYKIGVALGDPTTNNGIQNAVFKDGATTLFTVNGTMSAANKFIDATSVERDVSVWLSSQGYQTVSISGSSLVVTIGNAASGFTCLSCLYLEKIVASSGGDYHVQRRRHRR